MHFSRSLAGVALLGVFAAMAFAGAATGAPAQSEQSAVTQVASLAGEKLQLQKMGFRSPVACGRQGGGEESVQGSTAGPTRRGTCSAPARTATFRTSKKSAALSYKAPVGRERSCGCNG